MAKDKYDVCLTTYQALLMIPEIMKTSWHFCIFDEAHKLKNSESESATQARKLKTKRRLLLTGTPLMNDVIELWSLLNLLMH